MDKNKFMSARFWVTIFISLTYCIVILYCLWLAGNEKMRGDTFLGIFTGFSALAGMVIKSYFDRTDRKREEENGANKLV